jgi:TonB family protein
MAKDVSLKKTIGARRTMSALPVLRLSLAASSLLCLSAHAEWRCDCTTVVDTCNATVTVENNGVAIASDRLQCARVDYLIDGLPFVALVVDGKASQSWLSRSENPRVLMQSCRVCLDNSVAGAPAVKPAEPVVERAPAREAEVSRLLAVNPKYPAAAAAAGVAGFVEVSFAVTALGLVENAAVAAAEPPGVFEQSALAAISRWRYNADEGRQPVTLSHRFAFKPEDAASASASSGATTEAVIDSLIARAVARSDGGDPEVAPSEPTFAVRNQCIREQVSYDFGEMVEVNLMNTCSEPLMVYGCAEGLGRYHRRWVCHTTESAQNVLVRPGDRLVGNSAMLEVPQGVRTFRYDENFFVARARNTEYWWLACDVNDAECRDSGRLWARSMNGKDATVDPQLWTEQSIARSY